PGGRRVRETGPGTDRRFRYDRTGRLTEVVEADGTVSRRVSHDAAGRRMRERAGDAEVRYSWDRLGRLAGIHRRLGDLEQQTPVRTDPFGDIVQFGSTPMAWDRSRGFPVLRWMGGVDVIGATGPLALAGPFGATWLGTDARGTVGTTGTWGAGLGLPVHPAMGPVGIGFRDELTLDGLLWLRHRTYDPDTGAFLSGDPLPPVLGSPTVANPYHFGFNDPVGHADPLGLQPLTDADIAHMREQADRNIFDRAADEFSDFVNDPIAWVAEHADAIGAGLVIVGGVALCFTPLAPIGAGILTGAGTSMASQVAFTGQINARQVWVDGLVGGLSGGAGGFAAGLTSRLGTSAAMRIGSQVASGAAIDTAGSAMSQYLTTGRVDPSQLAVDGVTGGVTGGLGGAFPSGAVPHLAPSTTTLGENMTGRVMPFADATGARTLGFGSTADEWAAMTPQQRYHLNDGMLRARMTEGDDFRYIGQDPSRPPEVRARFDLTRSELLRLDERGVPYDVVSPDEVFKTIGRY
ncbi:MAG: RHS repeat-associated core domain-containing protein, partial [Acidimicrobiales bacterium]